MSMKNNISNIKEEARLSAIKKIRTELRKNKDFYSLKKLDRLIENGEI